MEYFGIFDTRPCRTINALVGIPTGSRCDDSSGPRTRENTGINPTFFSTLKYDFKTVLNQYDSKTLLNQYGSNTLLNKYDSKPL